MRKATIDIIVHLQTKIHRCMVHANTKANVTHNFRNENLNEANRLREIQAGLIRTGGNNAFRWCN